MKVEIGTVCLVIAPPRLAFYGPSGAYIGKIGTVYEWENENDFAGGIAYGLNFPDGGHARYARPCLIPMAPPRIKTAGKESVFARAARRIKAAL